MILTVTKETISPQIVEVGTRGSYNIEPLEFVFDEFWTGKRIYIKIDVPDGTDIADELEDDTYTVPKSIMDIPGDHKFTICYQEAESDGITLKKALNSLPATMRVANTLLPVGEWSDEETINLANQMAAKVDIAEGIVADLQADLAAGDYTPVFSIGEVVSGIVPDASITGTPIAPVLNLTMEKGEQGIQGVQGVQGIQGIQGLKGDTGDDAFVSAGTVTTVDSETAASITNTGTPGSAVFNFSIPRGESGSPKGVYDTLSALSTAHPTGTTGVYVVTADGKWYYWNSTAWTEGGVYQATAIADGSIVSNKLSENINLGLVLKTNMLEKSLTSIINAKGFYNSGSDTYYDRTNATSPSIAGNITWLKCTANKDTPTNKYLTRYLFPVLSEHIGKTFNFAFITHGTSKRIRATINYYVAGAVHYVYLNIDVTSATKQFVKSLLVPADIDIGSNIECFITNVDTLVAGDNFYIGAPQVIFGSIVPILSIHPNDNYYIEDGYIKYSHLSEEAISNITTNVVSTITPTVVKTAKESIKPLKIFTVANDINSSRNQSATIYVDHMLSSCDDETVVFEDTGKDFTIIEPAFEQYDDYTNGINHGVNKYTEVITRKVSSDKYTISDISLTHISTKATVGKNSHPKVLFIGDSITAGVGVRDGGIDLDVSAFPYWVGVKNLFDMDKIDAGNNASEYNFTSLGAGGDSLSTISRYASQTYKGITTSSKQSSSGMSSWGLINHMRHASLRQGSQADWDALGLGNGTFTDYTGSQAQKDLMWQTNEVYAGTPINPFFDNSKIGTNRFSILKMIERYRTLDDDGNRLTLASPTLGTQIVDDYQLKRINVCTPTHIVLQHGRNDESRITQYLNDIGEFINVVKSELPNAKISVCIPPDYAGTFFPERYPNVKPTGLQTITFPVARKSYDISKALINSYGANTDITLIPNYFVSPTAKGFPLRVATTSGTEKAYYPYFAGGLSSHGGFYAHLNWAYQVYSWIKSTLA